MWFNPIIMFLLRSPLHGLLSGSMMLVTIAGRKTGRQLTVPTNYVRRGETLYVISLRERTWWRNLRGGAPVTVRLKGQDYAGAGCVIADDVKAVAASLAAYFHLVPQYAKYSGVKLDAKGEPELESVQSAAASRVMVEIQLAHT